MTNTWIKGNPVLLLLVVMVMAACGSKQVAPAEKIDPSLLKDPVVKSLTEEIEKSPGDAALYFERAKAFRQMRQDSMALRDCKKAASLDSTKAQYFSTVADLLYEHGDITESIKWIEKAIKIDPNDRKAHLKIAKLFVTLKEYPRGFEEINIVLKKNPYDPEGYFLKGLLYMGAGDTARAISAFQTAVQVSPDYKDAMVELGLIYTSRNDTLGNRYLENAFSLDTNNVRPLYSLGARYQERKDYERAKQIYRRCIVHDRKFTDAYFSMGYILMQQDSTAKAWRQYDMAVKSDPGNPSAYFNRGLCSEIMDSLDDALHDYKMSLMLDTGYEAPKKALMRFAKK